MKRIFKAYYLLPLIVMVGISQYAMVAVDVIMSGGSSLWQLDSDALSSAGPLRYVKDIFVFFLSLSWIVLLPKLSLPKPLLNLVKVYFFWMLGIVTIGVFGFLLGYSPFSFLPAGLRWLMLLHAAFGVFLLTSTLITEKHKHKFIYRFLVIILMVDAYAVLLQLSSASSLLGLTLGASRLTGLFSNAGVAAFFAIGVALLAMQLDGVVLKKRIAISIFCIFLALSSGTRFATFAIFLLLMVQIWEMLETSHGRVRGYIKLIFIPIFLVACLLGYQALNQQVDRGDAISQQFEKGGRIGNLLESIDMLYSADLLEVLVGRGLGVGTNTAIAANMSEGIDPGIYRFNILVDNAFLTGIFQFGILGSLLFWVGILKFISFAKPKYSKVAKYRYIGILMVIGLTLLAGSPFEHFFLMMFYSVALGAVYWSDRLAYKKIKLGH